MTVIVYTIPQVKRQVRILLDPENNIPVKTIYPGGDYRMTEQEAVCILLNNYPPKEADSLREAYDIAINSLRITSKKTCGTEMLPINNNGSTEKRGVGSFASLAY